ncbi:MAG: hypothetical protein MI866_10235 [Bacteroidales bacterium]|nr:hypothetical protein [Bacteroidales bacterium]
MIWNKIIRRINEFFKEPVKKQAQKRKAIKSLERKMKEGENIPFGIVKIYKNGFNIKAEGILGFISFSYMPWQYLHTDSWKYVLPSLKKRRFYGKIYKIQTSPVRFVLNAEIPQFKRLMLVKNQRYKGIIINKSNDGITVDFGYNFNWHCGSITQFFHLSTISEVMLPQLKCGEVFEAKFTGMTEALSTVPHCRETIHKLVGKQVRVLVKRRFNKQISFWVDGQYQGLMPFRKQFYQDYCRTHIRQAINKLHEDEWIHCLAIDTCGYGKTLLLKWISETEIQNSYQRASGRPKLIDDANFLSNEALDKAVNDVFRKLEEED